MVDEEGKVNLVKKHHVKSEFTYSRPRYREARWERAVKVYTINLESKYLLVQGVPTVGVTKELLELFALYGDIQEYRMLEDYPKEEFTEVYWIKYQRINAARYAKRKTDNHSFFGGVLHVSYAPEFESVDDTREKLQERRKIIARKTKELFGNQTSSNSRKEKELTSSSSSTSAQHDNRQNSVVTNQEVAQSTVALTSSPSRISSHAVGTSSVPTTDDRTQQPNINNSWTPYPQLPPPPLPLHPNQYPPPPPSWELPWVPSANATLPLYLQRMPPPPPPPPPSEPPPDPPRGTHHPVSSHCNAVPVPQPPPGQPPGPPPGQPPGQPPNADNSHSFNFTGTLPGASPGGNNATRKHHGFVTPDHPPYPGHQHVLRPSGPPSGHLLRLPGPPGVPRHPLDPTAPDFPSCLPPGLPSPLAQLPCMLEGSPWYQNSPMEQYRGWTPCHKGPSLQTVDDSVDRTVMSIRNKMKQISSAPVLTGPYLPPSSAEILKSKDDGQSVAKKQRKRI